MDVFSLLRAEISTVSKLSRVGHVIGIGRGTLSVGGLSDVAALGDLVVPGPTYTNVNDFRALLIT
jgi:hypothetical protein